MNRILRFFRYGLKSLKRERFFAVVNIFGLSLGMYCFITSSLYVHDELTHDQWHSNVDRVFMPKVRIPSAEGQNFHTFPPYAFGEALKEGVPGVEEVVNISHRQKAVYKVKEEWFEQSTLHYTQNSLFKVFDFELKYGDESTVLTAPNTVVLSSELAAKHFPGQNPLGESIEFKDWGMFKIVGVLNPIPGNSHLQFDLLIPIDYSKGDYEGLQFDWSYQVGLFYVLASDGLTQESLTKATANVLANSEDKERAEMYEYQRFGAAYMKGQTFRSDIHTSFSGQMKYVYIFSAVGLLILLVACFNYINLTTARSFSRSKDLAIRKIVGASRSRLIYSGIGETLFLALLSIVIALIAVEITLPAFNNIIGKRLALNFLSQPDLFLLPIAVITLVVLISGVYPAVVSSTFNLASLLKGNTPRSKGQLFRKGLVIFQFLICAGLLSTALIIRSQANYLINMDLGYNAKNVINLDIYGGGFGKQYKELKTELERIPQIEVVSASAMPNIRGVMFIPMDVDGQEQNEVFWHSSADNNIVELFGFELVEGRSFDQLPDSELSTAVLLNETAAEKFDVEDLIGHEMIKGLKVVGVVKDFHYNSGKSEINPLMIQYNPNSVRYLHLRFREGDREAVMAQVTNTWDSFNTNKPFAYTDVDGFFKDAYEKEETLVQIFDLLTVLLVLIAFLGLFALSTFENQLRQKEMSIRRVLGAGHFALIQLMNRRFILLILISLAISIPATYYLVRDWLNDFPYRLSSVSLPFVFSSVGVIIMAVMVLTVHGYRNARKNPVDVLRNE